MTIKRRPAADRFHELTRLDENGCLVWAGYVQSNGYARLWVDGKNLMAHRWSYEFYVGPIPEGQVIDHLCRNRACVNPAHLEPVSQSENIRRGILPELTKQRGSRVTHCPQGHEYTEENTKHRKGNGRACRECGRASVRRHYRNNKEAYKARIDYRRAPK